MTEVVVSGIGIVSPLGGTRDGTWTNLLAGRTGIHDSTEGLRARVINFSPNGARTRMGDFAIIAAAESLRQAGLTPEILKENTVGCAIGQSKPILSDAVSFELNPSLLLASFTGWSTEAVVRREFSLSGPAANLIAACATGVASIELGAYWIKSGQCEIALVGAAESSYHPLYRAGFKSMGVLADGKNAECVKPFDLNRSGFVMGEGAAVLVLESQESCRRRGHKPLASLNGVCLQQSSIDPIKLESDGSSVARLIRKVLSEGPPPDYINAHGTATPFNDEVETRGIKLALGKKTKIPVSSTKAATGHLLGAAGALEAAFCVLALQDQILPPTLHLRDADPECDLDYVPQQARSQKISTALSLSYGFGGQMGAVLFGLC